MKVTIFCLFAALTAGTQTTAEPVTDAEKIAERPEGLTKLHNWQRDYRGLSSQQGRRISSSR